MKTELTIQRFDEEKQCLIVLDTNGQEVEVDTFDFQQTQKYINHLPKTISCYIMADGTIKQSQKELLEQCFKKKKGHATFIVEDVNGVHYQLLDFFGFSHPYEDSMGEGWEPFQEVEMTYNGISCNEEKNTAWLNIEKPYNQDIEIEPRGFAQERNVLENSLSTSTPIHGAQSNPNIPRITQREGRTVELKSSFVYTQQGVRDIDKQMQEIVQAIAAFMNADGGKLYLGVRDNGEVRGVEEDLQYIRTSIFDMCQYKSTQDGLKQKIYSSVRHHLGTDAGDFVKTINFKSPRGFSDLHYAIITVKPATEIIWYGIKGYNPREDMQLYVRRDGNVQRYPTGAAMQSFILRRANEIQRRMNPFELCSGAVY